MVPPVREDLYEKVVAAINPRGEAGKGSGEPTTAGLPETWAAIKPGHLVLIQDSLVDVGTRRLSLAELATRSPSGPATTRLSKLHRPGDGSRSAEPSRFLKSATARSRAAYRHPGCRSSFTRGETP